MKTRIIYSQHFFLNKEQVTSPTMRGTGSSSRSEHDEAGGNMNIICKKYNLQKRLLATVCNKIVNFEYMLLCRPIHCHVFYRTTVTPKPNLREGGRRKISKTKVDGAE